MTLQEIKSYIRTHIESAGEEIFELHEYCGECRHRFKEREYSERERRWIDQPNCMLLENQEPCIKVVDILDDMIKFAERV